MPVPRALPVEVEQLRRKLAADIERGQAGMRGAGGDQLRPADPGDRLLDAGRAQGLDADQRILAATDRDQRVYAQAKRLCRRFCSPDKANGRIRGSGNLIPRVRFAYPGYRAAAASRLSAALACGGCTVNPRLHINTQLRASLI